MKCIAIAIGASVFILIIIRTLSYRDWTLIYSTFGNEEYFRIIAILKSAGIKFKIETPSRGIDTRTSRFKDNTQYNFYVKKEEEHLAVKVLHK
ncbi:hypothetical protein [Neobacillus mesonae]|uniref:hypothetical protein n=1 Tax=Neobacillus mesonae TaxID=1193713 RepID=UPI002E20BED6|nr:hypothetical protein [Neobacillus mesonae]